jgi:hypothetical protein
VDDVVDGEERGKMSAEERMPLWRFVNETSWTRMWGCYLNPLRYFGADRPVDPIEFLRIMKVLELGGVDVAITRGGGLFVRTDDLTRTPEAVHRVVKMFNVILCHLTFRNITAHPVTDTDIQDARLIDDAIAIVEGWGMHGEMSWAPLSLLASLPGNLGAPGQAANSWWPPNFYWHTEPFDVNEFYFDSLGDAIHLEGINEELPALIVSAGFHVSRHNLPEAIASAWLVCECLLSALWDDYVAQIESSRRRRLRDFRTYTAAVRVEVLLTAGYLGRDLAEELQAAREIRNDLAHNAEASMIGASTVFEAMRSFLRQQAIGVDNLQGFPFIGGGVAQPPTSVEPRIPLRKMIV